MSDRRDHAVDHPPRGDADAPARSIDAHGRIEVDRRIEAQQLEPEEKPAEIYLPLLASSAGGYLHHHWLGDGNLRLRGDELSEAPIDRASCRPVLIIADIVETIALAPTLESALSLALIVLVRTFLSFSRVDLEGVFPWRKKSTPRPPRRVVCRHGARSRPPSVLLLLGCGDWVAGEQLGADRVGRRS